MTIVYDLSSFNSVVSPGSLSSFVKHTDTGTPGQTRYVHDCNIRKEKNDFLGLFFLQNEKKKPPRQECVKFVH